jgi:hypothetical protein
MRLESTTLLLLLVAAGCGGGVSSGGGDDDPVDPGPPPSQWDQLLASRGTDYGESLRTASLRLVGDLPTLAEIKFVTEAADPKQAYLATVDGYLEDPRFPGRVRDFFRDSFKMGGSPELDTAPNFAAQLVVERRPFTDLFTAAADDCPSFDGTTFTPGTCESGAPARAGVLTNPHVMRHYFSNMAFRRVRWVQETFVCTKFPAEVIGEGSDVGGAQPYTAPWPFEGIGSPETGGTVNFLDVSAVTCANCHATMNRQAPLFAHFDDQGMWQADFAVPTPLEGAPMVTLADYLIDGETTAWRMGFEAADLADLGAHMAVDPAVAECLVARVWNWAMGKGDIVASLSLVPASVIRAQVESFAAGGYDLKQIIREVFTHDDFTKW